MDSYFRERAYEITKKVFSEENQKKMKLNENYQIIFIGHSLGGAIVKISCY